MGGLVSRYALAYMEQNNIPHNVSTLVLFDTPNRGANAPFGIQTLAWFGANYMAEAQILLNAIRSPAARQMLVYTQSIASTLTHDPLRDQLISEFTSLGEYPNGPVKIGIANGSAIVLNQKYNNVYMNPSSPILDIILNVSNIQLPDVGTVTQGTITFHTWAVPDQTANAMVFQAIADVTVLVHGGQWTVDVLTPLMVANVSNTEPYDNTPGGYYKDLVNLTVANGTISFFQPYFNFVPTISSLDLDPSQITGLSHNVKNDFLNNTLSKKTPFDAILFTDSDNEFHVQITSDKRNFTLDKLTNVFIQNKFFNDVVINQAENILTAGNNVDPFKTQGSVIVGNNANVTFIARNEVILSDGFETEGEFYAFTKPLNCVPLRLSANTHVNKDYSIIQTFIPFSELNPSPINQKKTESLFNLYPNPTTGILTILSEESLQTIEVMDVLGNVVYSKAANNQPINVDVALTAYPKGIYFLRAYSADKIYTEKVVIQ